MKTTTTRHEKNASAAVSLLGRSGLKTVLLATMATTGAVVDAQDACRFPPEPFRSTKGALPRTQTCFCDTNGTLCEPSDLCFSISLESLNDEDEDNGLPGNNSNDDAFRCFIQPCDDIAGDWLYLAQDQDESVDLFIVLATVEITQTNCEAEIMVTTGNGTIELYHATISWNEVYYLNVFESKTRPDASSADYYDPTTGHPRNSTIFLQNFESSAPQCAYFGEFGTRMSLGVLNYLIRARGPGSSNSTSSYAIGQALAREEVVPFKCPAGYPKQWTATPGGGDSSGNNNKNSTTSTATPSGAPVATRAPAVVLGGNTMPTAAPRTAPVASRPPAVVVGGGSVPTAKPVVVESRMPVSKPAAGGENNNMPTAAPAVVVAQPHASGTVTTAFAFVPLTMSLMVVASSAWFFGYGM